MSRQLLPLIEECMHQRRELEAIANATLNAIEIFVGTCSALEDASRNRIAESRQIRADTAGMVRAHEPKG